LRNHRDIAGPQRLVIKCAAGRQGDALSEVDQADGVRPQHAHVASRGLQGLLARDALLAGFAITTGKHDGRRRAHGRQFGHGLVGAFGAEQDDGGVRHFRQCGDVGIARQPIDLGVAWIDRVQAAGEAMFTQERDGPAGGFLRVPGGADHGDTARVHQAGNAVHAHPLFALAARKAATDAWCSAEV